MIVSNLKQGSDKWLELRKKCITSTDASIINGTNKFRDNSPFTLWQRKLGLLDEGPVSVAMIEGISLEEAARTWYNNECNLNMKPAVVFKEEHPWVMASLDGFQDDLDYIIEIKCGAKTYEKATVGIVPDYYYDQMQHALFVTNKKYCKYICYRINQDPIEIDIQRNDVHIEVLFQKEQDFYHCLVNMIAPSLEEKDYLVVESEEANQVAVLWKKAKEKLEEAKVDEQKCRKTLLEETDDGNTLFEKAGVKVDRINCKGQVNWQKVCEKFKIEENDLESFRKKSIGYPRITVIDQQRT